MKQYQFKTNINCGGCVAKITPVLNADKRVAIWNVDTTNPSKVLTVETVDLKGEEISQLLQNIDFTAEAIH